MFSLTTEQLMTMDRFELIATWLVGVTRRKAGREDTGGLKVEKLRGRYVIMMPGVGDGKAVLFQGDAGHLFDYAHRTMLNGLIRVVEDARAQAIATQDVRP